MDIDWYAIDKYYSIETGVEEVHPELLISDPQVKLYVTRIKAHKLSLKLWLENLESEGEKKYG